MVASVDVDNNHDGKNGYLEATLSFPLEDDETVRSVNAFFFFDVKLRLFSRISVHGVANVQQQADFGASKLTVSGDLILVQKTNLPYKGTNNEFNATLIDETTSVSGFDLNGLMESYTARNLSTVFVYNYNGWQEGESAENDFKLKISINYPKQQLRYEPGFLEEIKFAWMQYLSIFVIFFFIVDRLKTFIFQNQIFPTVPMPVFCCN